MSIFHAGDIAPEQASALLDVTLGEFLVFAEHAKAVADNHGGIVTLRHLEGKQCAERAGPRMIPCAELGGRSNHSLGMKRVACPSSNQPRFASSR
jgi:hypothetical protein